MTPIFNKTVRNVAACALAAALLFGAGFWTGRRASDRGGEPLRSAIPALTPYTLPQNLPGDAPSGPAPVAAAAPAPVPGNQKESGYTNRLVRETSPYLRMHAHNPIDWHPWGDDAFEKARKENKPIFLSVGYAACHWCGVMERESFSDPAVGAVMNRNYVAVKVDREERPDIDRVYLLFLQLTTGGSGYPMTLLLTPDLKPIIGGTYFPKEAGGGLPSFMTFLTQYADAWNTDRENVLMAANTVTEQIREHLQDQVTAAAPEGDPDFEETFHGIRAQYDKANGGFGTAPKYAQPPMLNFLLRHHARTGEREALDMALLTLRKIADGGLHDHLGGGFFRYATDAAWQVPHFEKMLYDQAQLATAYVDAYQITRDEWFSDVARETLDFVLRDMKSPAGGFYSAQSADSAMASGTGEVGEGAAYVWEAKTVESALGAEAAAVFSHRYGIEPDGNVPAALDIQGELKGKNVLFVRHSIAETASHFGKPEQEIERLLQESRKKLAAVRAGRPQPPLDRKVVTGWNGLMLSALARAAQVLDDARYAREATALAGVLKTGLLDAKSGTLRRSHTGGQTSGEGFLEDYAFLVQGLLDLYETSFDVQWLTLADRLEAKQRDLFWDAANNTYFATAADAPSVLFRMRDEFDGAEPSANSIAAMNLLRLAQFTDDEARRTMAEKAFDAFAARLRKSPDALPQMMAALDFSRSKPKQIVIAGKPGAPDTAALLRLVHERYIPNKFLMLADGGAGQAAIAQRLPFVGAMRPIDGKATAYICEDYACRFPTSDPAAVARILDGKEP